MAEFPHVHVGYVGLPDLRRYNVVRELIRHSFIGIVTMCQGFVTSFAGLVGCRFLLGCFEAGLAPGEFGSDSQYVNEHGVAQLI